MRGVRFGLACTPPSHPLVCRLRRVRDVTRSKPRPEAVGGSRKSAGEVDESETGSANETAPFGGPFHFPGQSAAHFARGRPQARLRRACLWLVWKVVGFGGWLACSAAKPRCWRSRVCRVAVSCTCVCLPSTRAFRRFFGRSCSFSTSGSGCSPSASRAPRRSFSRSSSGSSATTAPLDRVAGFPERPDQTRSVLRDASCSRLRARTSKPASTSPTLSSRRACADSTGLSHVRARTCARRRLSPLAADVSSSGLTSHTGHRPARRTRRSLERRDASRLRESKAARVDS